LEEELRQSQKMEAIGRLAGGIAHDFNNLLTIINGFSELLLKDQLPLDSQRESITAILDAGQRAAQLTGQLLAFSRRALITPRVLDLNEAIDSVGKMLRRVIGEDIVLTTVLHSGLRPVRIDPGQVEQLIMNLGVNARDAMPEGGELRILTDTVDSKIEIIVQDTGVGISRENIKKIYDPFFTTKAAGKGTGLGLSVSYGIVQEHGGNISVDSKPGVGTSFKLELPLVRKPVNV